MQASATPKPAISVIDAVVIIAGVVIGAGIFRTPSIVAANSGGSELLFLGLWLAGGAVSLVGALCYAELASTYPDAGGDYHYLRRAFGAGPSFLFAWARLSVIQTGSIAIQAFVVGDYAAELLPIGHYSSAIYAALTVGLFTTLNVVGLRPGTWTQHVLTWAVIVALLAIVGVGLLFSAPAAPRDSAAAAAPAAAGIGLAMVFVLLTYGGWNEAAYVSAEIRGRGVGSSARSSGGSRWSRRSTCWRTWRCCAGWGWARWPPATPSPQIWSASASATPAPPSSASSSSSPP